MSHMVSGNPWLHYKLYLISHISHISFAPEQRYWQNRETANVGLDSSVGRAPARQSGGRRFKSRSSKFFFVHPNSSISHICYKYKFWSGKTTLEKSYLRDVLLTSSANDLEPIAVDYLSIIHMYWQSHNSWWEIQVWKVWGLRFMLEFSYFFNFKLKLLMNRKLVVSNSFIFKIFRNWGRWWKSDRVIHRR